MKLIVGYNVQKWENSDYEIWFNRYKNILTFGQEYIDKNPSINQSGKGFMLLSPFYFQLWWNDKKYSFGKVVEQ